MAHDFQKKDVAGTAFDAKIKNYVFTTACRNRQRLRAWSS
jgi:hypothetical protein